MTSETAGNSPSLRSNALTTGKAATFDACLSILTFHLTSHLGCRKEPLHQSLHVEPQSFHVDFNS
jgi:hypothetical protein